MPGLEENPLSAGAREAADLLARLVACPSVNPRGREPAPPFGEGRIAELLSGLLSEWGAEVTLREVAPGRPNLIARFEGEGGGPVLMLETHSDTVQTEGMEIAPFEPVVRDGRLYGRGAADAKGSLAAMLLAIRGALGAGGRPPCTICFVSTCNEELGATGASSLVEDGFTADAAVVGEPTGLAVVPAHKGAVRWRIATRGVAAHSSNPSRGVNAISRMRRVLDLIEGPVAEGLRGRRHPLLGEPAITVGTIRGGTQVNTVPDLCEIEVDRRTIPGETAEGAAAEVARGLEAMRAAGDFEFSLEQTECYPPFEEDREAPVIRLAEAACRKALGEARLSAMPWGSNAGFFKRAGIPCVVFGPGSDRQAHAAVEYVDLEEVAKAARVYGEIIRAFCGSPRGPGEREEERR